MTGQPGLGLAATPTHLATERDVAALVEGVDPPMERMGNGHNGRWRWSDPASKLVVTASTGRKHAHQVHIENPGGWFATYSFRDRPLPAGILLAAIQSARDDGRRTPAP